MSLVIDSGVFAMGGNMQNSGKLFENDIKQSIPQECWIYRLRDNASSFANGDKTRFTSSNICDFLLLDDLTKTLFLIECKSTKSTSVPFTMIRENQLNGLLEASKHNLVAGMIVNFRNQDNDTFFLPISEYKNMVENLNKKSFNIKDLRNVNVIRIGSTKKRTRYTYHIRDFIKEVTAHD